MSAAPDNATEVLKPVAQGSGLASLGVQEASSPATSQRPSIADGADSLAAAFDPLSSKKDEKAKEAPPTASKELKINDLYSTSAAAAPEASAALPSLKLEAQVESLDDMLADFGK